MKECNLKQLGLAPTRRHGSAELTTIEDSVALLAACEEHLAGVLGIEGFHVCGNQRIPDMNCIADFSSFSDRPNFETASVNAARSFLRTLDPHSGILLEFVLVTRR